MANLLVLAELKLINAYILAYDLQLALEDLELVCNLLHALYLTMLIQI